MDGVLTVLSGARFSCVWCDEWYDGRMNDAALLLRRGSDAAVRRVLRSMDAGARREQGWLRRRICPLEADRCMLWSRCGAGWSRERPAGEEYLRKG